MKIRFPAELKARIEEAARENNRSMNAEVVHRLEQSLFSDDEPNDERTIYIVMDYQGMPTSWPEVLAATENIAKLSNIEYNSVAGIALDANIVSSNTREEEWLDLRERYRKIVADFIRSRRKNKQSSRGS